MYMWFLSFSFLVNLQETEKNIVRWLAFFYNRHMTILGVIVKCLLKKKNPDNLVHFMKTQTIYL